MNKTLRTVLAVLGIAVLWVVLASINAGLLGFGVILPVVALLDIVTGEFAGGNKMVWLVVTLAALLFAVIGIGAGMFFPPLGVGKSCLGGCCCDFSGSVRGLFPHRAAAADETRKVRPAPGNFF